MNFIEFLLEKYPSTKDVEGKRWVTIYPDGKYYPRRRGEETRRKKKGIPVLINVTEPSKERSEERPKERPKEEKKPRTPEQKEEKRRIREKNLETLRRVTEKTEDTLLEPNQIHKELNPLHRGYSDDIIYALKSYTGSAFKLINKALRVPETKINDKTKERIKNIDAAMEKSEVKTPFKVFRGMYLSNNNLDKYKSAKPGDSIIDKGFVSTSSYPSSAFGGNVRLEIVVPKGARAISLKPISNYSHEEEVLLDRGGSFRVLENTEEKVGINTTITKLKVVYEPRKE